MSRRSRQRGRAPTRVPPYRKHATGQAVVRLNGQDFYLGAHGSPASRKEYNRLIGEWLARGRCLPAPEVDLKVAELILRYWKHAQGYYVKDGRPTSEFSEIRYALGVVRKLYGTTSARDFGPLALATVARQGILDGQVVGAICANCN